MGKVESRIDEGMWSPETDGANIRQREMWGFNDLRKRQSEYHQGSFTSLFP